MKNDRIEMVFLPRGTSRGLHKQEIDQNLDEIESDVFAPLVTRRIGNSDWFIRVLYHRPDGIFAFEMIDKETVRYSDAPPLYSCMFCANPKLAREYWKVAMLINPDRVPMPTATPWIVAFISEHIGPYTNVALSQLERSLSQVAWAVMQRFTVQGVFSSEL